MRVGKVDRNGIARQAGFRTGDHTIFAKQTIEKARFAGVGTADDRELERAGCSVLTVWNTGGWSSGRKALSNLAHQVGDALVVLGGDGNRIAEAE